MKRLLLSFLYSFGNVLLAFAQSVYMHEAQEDASESEPITLSGIIATLVFIGIIWLIKTIISSIQQSSQESKRKSEQKRREEKIELRKKQLTPIDLGLSVMWAQCNVGASSMTNSGKFYAWGEIKEHYRFTKGLQGDASKIGDISGKPQYDIARYEMGDGWRMPTLKEGLELIEKCTWEKVNSYGKQGYDVIGPNGNRIFLPRTGMLTSLMSTLKPHYDVNTSYYWLSTPFEDIYTSVLEFEMDENPNKKRESPWCDTKTFRDFGFCVRAVKDY